MPPAVRSDEWTLVGTAYIQLVCIARHSLWDCVSPVIHVYNGPSELTCIAGDLSHHPRPCEVERPK